MQPNTKTFNNIYHATLELADKFRTHTWLDNDRSVKECEAELKSLAVFIDDGKGNEEDKRDEAREKTYICSLKKQLMAGVFNLRKKYLDIRWHIFQMVLITK